MDNAIGFLRAYPLSSDLPGGKRYPTFEQPGPEHLAKRKNVWIFLHNNSKSKCLICKGQCGPTSTDCAVLVPYALKNTCNEFVLVI